MPVGGKEENALTAFTSLSYHSFKLEVNALSHSFQLQNDRVENHRRGKRRRWENSAKPCVCSRVSAFPTFSAILDTHEEESYNELVVTKKGGSMPEVKPAGTELGNRMKLTEYISKECIVSNLKSNDKIHAIKELARLMQKKGKVDDMESVLERVLERESFDSTGIGLGIAIPHARVNTIDGLVCAVGRKREGMEYRSIDGKPVHLVFLILYPPSDSHKYLYFISSLSRLVLDEHLVERLMEATSSTAMYKVLDEASETLATHPSFDSQVTDAEAEGKVMRGTNSDLMLLIRLMRLENLKKADESQSDTLDQKVEQLRSCISPRVLAHYDRLKARGGQPVVAVEEEICLGCNIQLSSSFAQELRESQKVMTCPNCTRFLYVV
jgi:fructose-specific phosphotransferase system IIA component